MCYVLTHVETLVARAVARVFCSIERRVTRVCVDDARWHDMHISRHFAGRVSRPGLKGHTTHGISIGRD